MSLGRCFTHFATQRRTHGARQAPPRIWWGLAAAQLQDAPVWVWPIGVLPSLLSLAVGISWAAGIAQLPALLAILAAGIAGSVFVDLQLYRLAMCPRDWFSLRLQLSLSLAALAAVCGTG